MTKLHAIYLATVVLLGNCSPLLAQPLYHRVSSMEYLLGNSSAVFIGVPGTIAKNADADGVAWITMTFSVEETLKGIHQTGQTLCFNDEQTRAQIDQRIREFEGYRKNKCRCLVLVMSHEQPIPNVIFKGQPILKGQHQVIDLSDQAKVHVVAKGLKIVDSATTLVNVCRRYCKANPGALVTQGITFALPRRFAQKHFSYSEVMVTLPIDPSLKKLAKSFLHSNDLGKKRFAREALRYFGRDESGKSSKSP